MIDVKPVAKNTFTVEEMQIELDAAHLAQEHCRSLWGAARGRSDWRMMHDGFIAGYKAKNDALQLRIEALGKDAARYSMDREIRLRGMIPGDLFNATSYTDYDIAIDAAIAAKERA